MHHKKQRHSNYETAFCIEDRLVSNKGKFKYYHSEYSEILEVSIEWLLKGGDLKIG
jgi:hypothetical protein